jgi:hypothetical protein
MQQEMVYLQQKFQAATNKKPVYESIDEQCLLGYMNSNRDELYFGNDSVSTENPYGIMPQWKYLSIFKVNK